jgi:pyruvate-formate lyase
MAATSRVESTSGSDKSPSQGFRSELWQKEINVRDFIQRNYTPYEGDGSFLKGATARLARPAGRLMPLAGRECDPRRREPPHGE